MIDVESMEAYLKARKNTKTFIPVSYNDKFIPESELKKLSDFIKKYTKAEISKCFEKDVSSAKLGFQCEIKCHTCVLRFKQRFSQTKLLSFLVNYLDHEKNGEYSNPESICFNCESAKAEKRKKEDKECDKKRQMKFLENTKIYIETYLHPEMEWESGLKNSRKISCLTQYHVYHDEIADYIKHMDYQEFLKTPYWKAISEKKKIQSDFKCQLCSSSKNLATHHRDYSIRGYELQNLKELTVLCNECHGKFHDK